MNIAYKIGTNSIGFVDEHVMLKVCLIIILTTWFLLKIKVSAMTFYDFSKPMTYSKIFY